MVEGNGQQAVGDTQRQPLNVKPLNVKPLNALNF